MKPLISSISEANINKYAKILEDRGIKHECCMDLPHHPNDYLLKVAEINYQRAMKALYPNRDTPRV